MSKIKQRFYCVDGDFDTTDGELICVPNKKYSIVELCFKGPMHIPFARVKLFSGDFAIDADAVFDDATELGEEICRRWNKVTP